MYTPAPHLGGSLGPSHTPRAAGADLGWDPRMVSAARISTLIWRNLSGPGPRGVRKWPGAVWKLPLPPGWKGSGKGGGRRWREEHTARGHRDQRTGKPTPSPLWGAPTGKSAHVARKGTHRPVRALSEGHADRYHLGRATAKEMGHKKGAGHQTRTSERSSSRPWGPGLCSLSKTYHYWVRLGHKVVLTRAQRLKKKKSSNE